MINSPEQIYVEQHGKLTPQPGDVREQRAADAGHRPHRQQHRPPRRRVVADGRRPAQGRLARQRDHPAAGAARTHGDHPKVRQGGAHRRGPGRATARSPRTWSASCGPASADGSTSSSAAAPARERRPRSTSSRASSPRTSASSPSRTPPSSSSARSTWSRWRPGRPTSRVAAACPIRELVINSLRMRPDRIVVGECRGGEALDMLQAMNTGHDGSLTTLHANNAARVHRPPRDAGAHGRRRAALARHPRADRLGGATSSCSSRACATARARWSASPRCSACDGGEVQLQEIFAFRRRASTRTARCSAHFTPTGVTPHFLDHLAAEGEALPPEIFQAAKLARRAPSRTHAAARRAWPDVGRQAPLRRPSAECR